MAANQPALEIPTAPRDIEGLKAIAPFQLRLLATKLGAFATPEKQQAWHQLGNKEAQADYVLKLLKDHDAANGANGVGTNGAAHMPQLAAPSAVPAVNPVATALATAAAAPDKKAAPKRTPVAPGAQAMASPGPATGPSIDLGAAVLEKLEELAKAIAANTAAIHGLAQHVGARDQKTSEAFAAIASEQAKQTALSTWTLTTLLTMGEGQLGATPLDLLRSAVSDASILESLVAQVQQELGGGK